MPNSAAAYRARIRIDTSFLLAGLFLLSGLLVLLTQQAQEEKDDQWVIHTYQVINELQAIEALLVDTETGARGYIATHDTLFLQPYRQALPLLNTHLQTLPKLVADNPTQRQQAYTLNRLAKAKISIVNQLIHPVTEPVPRALLLIGKQRMDDIRRQVTQMITREQRLLAVRQQRVQNTYQHNIWITIVLVALALGTLGVAWWLIKQEASRRQLAQQTADYNAHLLRNVVDAVPAGIVLLQAIRDSTGQITDFVHRFSNLENDRAIGRLPEELRHSSLLEVLPASRTNGLLDDLIQVTQSGQPLRRLIQPHSLRSDIWFDIQSLKYEDGVLLTYLDVTALKETELALQTANQELQRSNESLEAFAYVASHDLQEPLRKIQSFGNLIKKQYASGLGEGLVHLERMQSAANRMSTLIHDLLRLSRLTKEQVVNTPVALEKLLETILNDLELVIKETGAQINVGDLPIVAGDPTQLGQLFSNLLGNSLKFRQPDITPKVTLSASLLKANELPSGINPAQPSATYHCIEVKDNGIGFNDKYITRIFQVFQRLQTAQHYPGSGIGLAICQKVVINHGGAITASSSPNAGTTFYIYLPA